MTSPLPTKEITLHGNRVCYREAGEGPALVLIHGITSNSETWREVMPWLAKRFHVIAPDLLGHGNSAKPRGDYSLGANASGVRDLMVALGVERATVVGHSLGGGIAMQFSYQFPERVERLALVSSGGLGRDVNPLLRAAALPGSEVVLPIIAGPHVVSVGLAIGRVLNRLGLKPAADLAEIARGYGSLSDVEARQAFVHTLRAVIDPGGQRVSALDRLYLAQAVPSLLVWGEDDPVIPSRHGAEAQKLMPGSRLEIFPGTGHFPQLEEPRHFVEAMERFMEETEPARIDPSDLRRRLLEAAGEPDPAAAQKAIPRRTTKRAARKGANGRPPAAGQAQGAGAAKAAAPRKARAGKSGTARPRPAQPRRRGQA